MNTLMVYNIVLIILTGLICYLHYTVFKLKQEVKAIWLQIAVVATATAREFTRLEEKNKDHDTK
jgi:hypothetical protein